MEELIFNIKDKQDVYNKLLCPVLCLLREFDGFIDKYDGETDEEMDIYGIAMKLKKFMNGIEEIVEYAVFYYFSPENISYEWHRYGYDYYHIKRNDYVRRILKYSNDIKSLLEQTISTECLNNRDLLNKAVSNLSFLTKIEQSVLVSVYEGINYLYNTSLTFMR